MTFLFVSCTNMIDALNESEPVSSGAANFVRVGGKISLNGAYPSALVNQGQTSGNDSETVARTSFISTTSLAGLDIEVIAKNVNNTAETYTGELSEGNTSFLIGIPVAATEKSYKIYASAKINNVEILNGESDAFTISVDETIANVNVVMHTVSSGNNANGGIKLVVTVDADCGIDGASVHINEHDYDADRSGTTYTFETGDNVFPVGAYSARFSFKKGDVEIYSLPLQAINIYSGFKTDTWVKNSSGENDEPYFVTTTTNGLTITTCHITKELIDNYAVTEFYVDSSVANSGNGVFFSPYKNITDAFSYISTNGKSTKDYTIYVKGSFSGNHNISDGWNTKAHSLTIIGMSAVDGSGNPTDTLTANGSGTTLTIGTTVPITIKNFKIADGYSSKGGGILVSPTSGKASLTLENVLITTCTAINTGGGICAEACDLVLCGNTKVLSCTGTNCGGGISINSTDSIASSLTMRGNSCIQSCRTTSINQGWGGGIYGNGKSAKRCTLTLTDCASIKGCRAKEGGGIGLVDFNDLYINGSVEISGNSATGSANSDGGGFRVWNSTATMTGGVVKENEATAYGAAISLKNGGLLTLSGSAYIPYHSTKKNEIYLGEGTDGNPTPTYIMIGGTITPPAEATDADGVTTIATIRPDSYGDNRRVLAEASTGLIAQNVGYFDVVPRIYQSINDYWLIDCLENIGYLRIGISFEGNVYSEYDAGDAAKFLSYFSALENVTSDTTKRIYIKLTDNINLSSSTNWRPIGEGIKDFAGRDIHFRGVFDGNGKTLKVSSNRSGGFCVVCTRNNGIIQNLKVEATSTIEFGKTGSAHSAFGGISTYNHGIIRNCWNAISCDGEGSSCNTGGICGYNQGGLIENCVNTGDITAKFTPIRWAGIYFPVGGITGHSFSGGVIKNCVNYGTITCHKSYDCSNGISGLAGAIAGRNEECELTNCYWRQNCVNSNTETGTVSYDTVNWMVCKTVTSGSITKVRSGTMTGNGYFSANNLGDLHAANADDAGSDQTLQYGDDLLNALNAYVNAHTGNYLCSWANGGTYRAIPAVFSN